MKRVKLFAVSVVVAAGIATATAAVAQRAAPEARQAAEGRGPTVYQAGATARTGIRWEYARFRYSPGQEDWSWRVGNQKLSGSATKIYRSFGGPPRNAEGDIWFGEIMTLAGQQGWEAMEMQDYETGSEVWFKRAAQ